MRICHIITKLELGGAQLTTLHLVSELSRAGHEVSLISSPFGQLLSDFNKTQKIKKFFIACFRRNINPINDLYTLYKIKRILKELKCEIVHTHSSKAGILGRLAARLSKVKIIIHTVHGWSFNDYQNTLIKHLFILLEKIAARFSTRIICVSERDIKIGLKLRIADKGKFILIRYGISASDFQNFVSETIKKRKKLGIENLGPVVAMISCLKPQKNPLDYIRAIPIVKRDIPLANFLLIGDGILRHKVLRLAKKLGLDGSFLFKGWRRDIPEILSAIDVLVLSSLWEGLPVVLLEAMASGKPVVATDVGGTGEIVRDGIDGFLVPPRDYRLLAQKIKTILNEDCLCKKMGQNFRARFDSSFCFQNMADKIERLYQSLVQ